MKTQKRFVISGMFKTLKFLGICLMLGALVAPGTQAEVKSLDPGTPGEGANNFSFFESISLGLVVFTDNKTIKWNAGRHEFRTPGYPNVLYEGVFLDETLQPVPTATFAGGTASGGADFSPDRASATLEQDGVFRGMLFTEISGQAAVFTWEWDPNDRPLVGQLDASGNQPPIADAGEPVVGRRTVPVSFDGSASLDPDGGTIVLQYDWDFGDGSDPLIDGGPTPKYTYTAVDTYNVTLTVTDNEGVRASDTTTATIGDNSTPPTADAGGPYGGVEGVELVFDGSASVDPDGDTIVQYDWDFGDGSEPLIDAGPRPTHIYAASDEYAVVLTVTNDEAQTDSASTTATITIPNVPPVADAGPDVVGAEGVEVTFDGSRSVDPDGSIVRYDWYFGDGQQALDAGPTPTHIYGPGFSYPSNFPVSLWVTDDDGGTASDRINASIGEKSTPPTADAGGPYQGQAGVDVSFNGSLSSDPDGGGIARYDWDFGDDSDPLIDGGPTPSYNYAEPGEYIVTLTVTDNSGETDTDTAEATVGRGNLPPQADAGDKVSGKVRRRITFDGTRSSDPDSNIESYEWNFGDEKTGTGQTPTHRYEEPGTYFVTLTVTDSNGATDSDATLAVISSRFECVEQCRADRSDCLDAADAAKETCIEKCDDRSCKRACRDVARAEKSECRAAFRACRAECR